MGIIMDLFLFDDQIQRFFGLNEIRKISSVMPFSFNAVELCVMTINERHLGRVLEKCAGHYSISKNRLYHKGLLQQGKLCSQVSIERVHRREKLQRLA